MAKENIIIISVIGVVLLLLLGWQSGFFAGVSKPVVIPEGIILFYGDGCPHCENVDDFISQNNIEEKVEFIKLEVWYNKDNQAIIKDVAKKCSINSKQIGVPFLYDGKGKCYTGDVDAIKFFKDEAGIQ